MIYTLEIGPALNKLLEQGLWVVVGWLFFRIFFTGAK